MTLSAPSTAAQLKFKVIKRDKTSSDFNGEKITESIFKAAQTVGGKDRNLAVALTELIVEKLSKEFSAENPPTTERTPAMRLKDQPTFEAAVLSNIDTGYGAAALLYAALWAGEMERELASGAALEAVADDCSHRADDQLGSYGVTEFQHGCAVGLLSAAWEHGEQLRRWHNLKTQIHDEGEKANESGAVLNPALVTLERKS